MARIDQHFIHKNEIKWLFSIINIFNIIKKL